MDSHTAIQHLKCRGCNSNPSYALMNGKGRLVCHCTHDDGDLEPYPVHGFAEQPDRWEFQQAKLVTDGGAAIQRTHSEKCPRCGRFCSVVYRWRGASYMEVPSCIHCGNNVPECGHEDGTVTGCHRNATQEVPDASYGRFWCENHAPDDAEPLPYTEDDSR